MKGSRDKARECRICPFTASDLRPPLTCLKAALWCSLLLTTHQRASKYAHTSRRGGCCVHAGFKVFRVEVTACGWGTDMVSSAGCAAWQRRALQGFALGWWTHAGCPLMSLSLIARHDVDYNKPLPLPLPARGSDRGWTAAARRQLYATYACWFYR